MGIESFCRGLKEARDGRYRERRAIGKAEGGFGLKTGKVEWTGKPRSEAAAGTHRRRLAEGKLVENRIKNYSGYGSHEVLMIVGMMPGRISPITIMRLR